MSKKGYYIKKSKVDQSLFLYIELNDWIKFRIFEREKKSDQFTHDMQIIK
jgi:hypothetical protein